MKPKATPSARPQGRHCEFCGKSGGVLSYRHFLDSGRLATRVWAHRKCLMQFRGTVPRFPMDP